jgi:hypothetical protein
LLNEAGNKISAFAGDAANNFAKQKIDFKMLQNVPLLSDLH